jgi:tetratricopeptide (TPR) repeat protein
MQNSTPSANSCYLSIFLLCPIAFLSGARVHAADPCSIALTTHSGTTHIDEDIRKFQQRAKRATNSAPYIERLGWTSVAKARDSHDPGFYSLAEQCASCIESRDPNNAAALLLRGHVLHNQHRFREAEEIARTIADRRGRWFDYALLGDVLIEQGDLEDAHAAYQAMMDRRPGPRAFS